MATDFEKVDAYINGPEDYEDIPEMTDEDFARGTLMMNGKPVGRSRGRPTAGEAAKRQITLRLDPDVIEKFKATGPGWQTRMNDALRAWTPETAA